MAPLPASATASAAGGLLLAAVLLSMAPSAGAIVIRADADDAAYRTPAAEWPALADLPGEGHGVLIAPRWVVTAAHAIASPAGLKQITLAGQARAVDRVVVHPGFQRPPHALLQQALATWDWTLFRLRLATADDIALIRLAEPVEGVAPVPLHRSGAEVGQRVQVVGKGATGDGVTGYDFAGPHRTALRRAFNTVTSADGRWLCYQFDAPPAALPLEGGSGAGDSGGPVLLQAEAGSGWALAGLTSWVDPQSTARTPGRYGQITCNVRLGHYQGWIDGIVSSQP